MSNLALIIPPNASERELHEWIESRGIRTKSIRIVRDPATDVLSAIGYVELKDSTDLQEAIAILHGKRMRHQTVRASGSADSPNRHNPLDKERL